METLPDDRWVVYVPSAPTVTLGTVHVVPAERVKLLDASVTTIVNSISQSGLSTSDAFCGHSLQWGDEIDKPVPRPD